ncbi:TMEM165/GDT1 family protein [Actinomycetota bacterium]
MTFEIATAAIVFGLIFMVELPDKTFIATLVLATRYRPLLVWIGVGLAFGVQVLIAVTIGGLLANLPKRPIEIFTALMFLIGGILLLRGAAQADAEEAETEEEFAEKAKEPATGWKAVLTSFLVLFLAEWGDLSQLLTASLAMKYEDPFSVGIGAWAALLAVSGLGAALGRVLLTRIRLATIRRIGGALCLLMALLSVLQIAGVISG